MPDSRHPWAPRSPSGIAFTRRARIVAASNRPMPHEPPVPPGGQPSVEDPMSRICQVTGRKTASGGRIARRGLPKKKGGVGLNTTGHTKRKFKVNLQWKRIWVPELGRRVRVRLSTRALKTISKNGAYSVLVKAGVIKPAGPNPS